MATKKAAFGGYTINFKGCTHTMEAVFGDKPVSPEELNRAKTGMTLTLPGEWETNGAVLRSLGQMVQFALPADYFTTYPGRINGLELGPVQQAGNGVIKPENVVYLVVGDRAAIEPGLKALNLGEIKLLDADGNPVPQG